MARYKSTREAGDREGGESPRLRRPTGAGDAPQAIEIEAVDGAASSEEALALAMHEALRKPLAGETRVQGLLVRIDCDQKGVLFLIMVGGRMLKLQSEGFDNLHLVAYTQDAGSQITCGPRKPENAVVITYRASANARAKVDGDMVAIEFVPATFQLKQ